MTEYTLSVITVICIVGSTTTAIIVALFAWKAARHTEVTVHADFLLRLDEYVRSFDKVHRQLRNGTWSPETGAGPISSEEWVEVEDYMGLFELLNHLVREHVISVARADEFYGYRYCNLISNRVIRTNKLEGAERPYWKGFIELGDSFAAYKGKRTAEEYCELS